MTLTCLYFVAPNDAAAATTLDYATGPANWPLGESVPGVEGRWTPHNPAESAQPSFSTVDSNSIEPAIDLSRLEVVLTGETFDAVTDRNARGDNVAIRDDASRLVVRLGAPLIKGLAGLDSGAIEDVAEAWADDEFLGLWEEPRILAGLVRDLSRLALEAVVSGGAIFCWIDA